MPDLISGRIRTAFRDLASNHFVLRQIDSLWQAEGFAHGGYEVLGGERVSLWRAYEAVADWTNPEHVARVMRVYEVVLSEHVSDETRDRLTVTLNRDGWRVDEYHRIVPIDDTRAAVAPLSGLGALRTTEGIEEAFNRLGLLLDGDPAGVIGAAKELLEATAKTVLDHLGIAYTDREDFSALLPRAQAALGLGAAGVDGSIDSAPSIRRILGGLASIAQGIDELRNAEGGGHGRVRATRLTTRHARLVVNSARAWCEIVLDTLGDPEAPWQRSSPP